MEAGGEEVVIRTCALTKRFRDVTAVDGLDLTVHRGEVYGFLGRNGAGKTTTIRMLLGLLRPSGGRVEVLGHEMAPNAVEVLVRIGSMVETPGAYSNLTVRENLELQRGLYGLKGPQWADAVISLCGLQEYADRKAGKLSLGNKQRLGIARALLGEPEILILDEPTNGLDPVGIVDIRNLLKSLASERGITVFLSSHMLSEVQQLATRIGIIHAGKLLEEIPYDELRKHSRVYLEFSVSDPSASVSVLRENCGVQDLAVVGDRTMRVFGDVERSGEFNAALVAAGIEVSGVSTSGDGLEEHFVQLTGGADESAEGEPTLRQGGSAR